MVFYIFINFIIQPLSFLLIILYAILIILVNRFIVSLIGYDALISKIPHFKKIKKIYIKKKLKNY